MSTTITETLSEKDQNNTDLPFGRGQVIEVGVMTTLNWTDHQL